MSDNITPFERYSRGSAAAVEAETTYPQDNRPEYKAFSVDKTKGMQAALRILYHDANLDKDSTEEAMPYPLVRVVATSHQYIAIYCSDGIVITLEGRNLKSIMEPLQDGHVRFIQRFHAAKFREPEDDAALITSINRQTMRDLMGGE